MLSLLSLLAAPQVVLARKALAYGLSVPPVSRWLPQMICLLHIWSVGAFWRPFAVA